MTKEKCRKSSALDLTPSAAKTKAYDHQNAQRCGSPGETSAVRQKHRPSRQARILRNRATFYASGGETGRSLFNSDMIKPSVRSKAPVVADDGRRAKEQTVFYWGDTWLRDTQTLYFTVKSKGGRMFITQVDGLGGEAAASVWQQLEQRNIGREMAEKEAGEEKSLPQFDGHIGPYAITFFMDASVFTAGEEVGKRERN